MYDVITMGSATVDAFVQTGDRLFRCQRGKKKVSVPFGSKIVSEDIHFDVGGGGTNTAVSFSRLGLKAAFLGKIGSGSNSGVVRDLLKREKVDISLMPRCRGRTGYSIVLDAVGHDRTIITFKGSNDKLKFDELKLSRLQAKWFYCSSMMGESYKTMERLVAWARKKGSHVMFNPSSYLCEKGKGHLRKMLSSAHVLVLNREEAMSLAKRRSVKGLLLALHSMGPRIVIITDGKHAVHMYDKGLHYQIRPSRAKVVESTGAGDAFGAGFLAGYIRKNEPEFALKLGLVNAESVLQHLGAKNKLLRWSEAASRVRQAPTVKKEKL
jgi:ribokinase